MRTGVNAADIARHGGVHTVRTHRVRTFDRRTGGNRIAWANTITCRDGWKRTLTTNEENDLKETLPEDLRAFVHEIEA